MKHDAEANKEKLLQCLERNLGIVTSACKEARLSRETFYKYYRDDIEFRKKVDDINEITLDFAESQLLKKIKDGSEKAILFYMKHKAKSRGYSEKIEIDTNVAGGLAINVIWDEAKKEDDDE